MDTPRWGKAAWPPGPEGGGDGKGHHQEATGQSTEAEGPARRGQNAGSAGLSGRGPAGRPHKGHAAGSGRAETTRDLGPVRRPGRGGRERTQQPGSGGADGTRGPGRPAGRRRRRPRNETGVPHSEPDRPAPRLGAGNPEAERPEGRGPPQPPAERRPGPRSPQPRADPGARASQQPRRREHRRRHLVSPPTASVVTSGSAPGAPSPRRRPAAFGRSLPVLGAEAAA